MKFNNKYISDLTAKDRNVAQKAAKHIIDEKDIQAWKCLIESADNIFDFIKQNICNSFNQVINQNNYKNIFEFFKIYSFDFDECLINNLIRFSDKKELFDCMSELIQNGTNDEKAYAAKYFTLVPNNAMNKYLFEAYENENEAVKYNVARALSVSKDDVSYNYYLNQLQDEDDWAKIDAAEFLQWYGNKNAVEPLLLALDNSTMPEHIACSLASLDNISKYFNSNNENIKKLSLDCYQYLIDSLAEVLPLSDIIDCNIFDCVENLIALINSDNNCSRYAVLLLKTKYQLETFFNNDEYKFNETKDTLEEMEGILEIINEGGKDFYNKCKEYIKEELNNTDTKRITYSVNLINILSLKEYIPELKNMLVNDITDDVIFEIISALNNFQDFDGLDKTKILSKIKDFNIKSAVEQMLI